MYDSTLGRFLQRDPIEFAEDGISLYEYARDDPAGAADPTGACVDPTAFGISIVGTGLFLQEFLEKSAELKKRVPQLLKDLESPQFAVRMKATEELEKYAANPVTRAIAKAMLNAHLNTKPTLEMTRRVESILEVYQKALEEDVRRGCNLNRLIANLDSNDFKTRVDATDQLTALLKNETNADVRKALVAILTRVVRDKNAPFAQRQRSQQVLKSNGIDVELELP